MKLFQLSPAIPEAFEAALAEARRFEGATAPNPPVGAVALDRSARILSVQAHPKAGTAHAEARVIDDLRSRGLLGEVACLVVTLEPCNHQGRTPPCAGAIVDAGIRQVVIGAADPNPEVAGGGAAWLAQQGVEVVWLTELEGATALARQCRELIAPFVHRVTRRLPWVTVKQALNAQGSMIPPAGQKTFTGPAALRLAHELRKRSDAILTGSQTVLADRPEFTVRHVSDHPGKERWLVVMDRQGRVEKEAPEWVQAASARGFRLRFGRSVREEMEFLYDQGVMEVLVEAGPSLTELILQSDIWCRHVVIRQHPESSASGDLIEDRIRPDKWGR